MKCSGFSSGRPRFASWARRAARSTDCSFIAYGLPRPPRAPRHDAGPWQSRVGARAQAGAPLAHSRSLASRCSSCFSCATPSPAGTSRASPITTAIWRRAACKAASRMGGCCASRVCVPDLVLCSTARRAPHLALAAAALGDAAGPLRRAALSGLTRADDRGHRRAWRRRDASAAGRPRSWDAQAGQTAWAPPANANSARRGSRPNFQLPGWR